MVQSKTLRRSVVAAALSLVGAGITFMAGAHAGAALDGKTHSVTVARIPVTSLMQAASLK
jgi:hypothetical protein